jgi:hypothetical protein
MPGRNYNAARSHTAEGAAHVFASATSFGAVTKSDSTVLDFNAVYVGVTGDVAIKPNETDAAVTFSNVPGGSILPVAGVRVMSANTTASSMVWLKF